MTTRKKKADAFAAFDQHKHALALRELDLSRALLVVYRYALANKYSWSRNDRELCKQVKYAAFQDLEDIRRSSCSGWCSCSDCGNKQERSNLRDVIDACDKVLGETEPCP